MSDIFKKIISFLFKKGANNAQNLTYMSSYSSGKTIITAHENMELNSSYDKQAETAEAEIEKLIRANYDTPENLYSYIRTSGTKIYKIDLFKPVLNYLKIRMGYVPILIGIKAGVLSLILSRKISFDLRDIFLAPTIQEKPITFFYKFYMWYFYKNNLLYIDEKISNLLFELDNEDNQAKIPTLTYHESSAISKIVKTDMQAIKFVMNIAESIAKAKAVSKKMCNDELQEN